MRLHTYALAALVAVGCEKRGGWLDGVDEEMTPCAGVAACIVDRCIDDADGDPRIVFGCPSECAGGDYDLARLGLSAVFQCNSTCSGRVAVAAVDGCVTASMCQAIDDAIGQTCPGMEQTTAQMECHEAFLCINRCTGMHVSCIGDCPPDVPYGECQDDGCGMQKCIDDTCTGSDVYMNGVYLRTHCTFSGSSPECAASRAACELNVF